MAPSLLPVSRPATPTAQVVVLDRRLAAIEVVPDKNGQPTMGRFTHLAAGSVLELCGEGFSPGTVQVRSGGAAYFVLDVFSKPEEPQFTPYL